MADNKPATTVALLMQKATARAQNIALHRAAMADVAAQVAASNAQPKKEGGESK